MDLCFLTWPLSFPDAHQSCSSADSSPQEEERDFDISDSESISEEGNLSNQVTLQRCGIVNPNYPGFQHLAHTLDYGIKVSSDTDDDFECQALTARLDAEANNINNNNNVEDTECQVDHIDGVNRLDSVENIQKVFYDKPVFVECENLQSNENNSADGSVNSIQSSSNSDDDSEVHVTPNIEFNIKADEAAIKLDDRIDTKEILSSEKAPERITLVNKVTNLQGKEYAVPCILTEEGEEKLLERAPTLQEIQEAVEKISLSNDLTPSATKYTIEPNIEQPLDKFTPTVLNDSETVKQNTMATLVQTVSTEPRIKIKLTQPEKNPTITPQYKMNVPDAFLSNVRENIPTVHQKLFTPNNDFDMMLETAKRRDSNRDAEDQQHEQTKMHPRRDDEIEKFCKEDKTKDEQEKDEDSAVPRKKEKVEISCVKKRRDYNNQTPSLITIPRREMGSRSRDSLNRRSMPVIRDKKRAQPDAFGEFIHIMLLNTD